MPYRRLPNTDKARLRALAKSYRKFESEETSNLPYSELSLQQLRTLYPNFKNALVNLEAARKQQSEKNKEYTEIHRKSRMYVAHYIQVMNFAIHRGEIKSNIRVYYETDHFDNYLPPLNTESDLLKWGKKVIDGDQQRIMKGGSPFYNPSIALVKINYEKFCEAYRFQKSLQATTERGSKLVVQLRKEVDQLILQLWNEIEAHFEHLSDQLKREKSEEFGLVYILRRKEKKKINEQAKQIEKDQLIELEMMAAKEKFIEKQKLMEKEKLIEKEKIAEKEKLVEKERVKFKVFQSQLNF